MTNASVSGNGIAPLNRRLVVGISGMGRHPAEAQFALWFISSRVSGEGFAELGTFGLYQAVMGMSVGTANWLASDNRLPRRHLKSESNRV